MSRRTIVLGAVAIVVLVAVTTGPFLVKKTSSPEFCASCHTMDEQYAHWRMTGLHRHAKCVDCHLPNNNLAEHLLWKGIDGGKDFILFHAGAYDFPLRITDHGEKVVQKNCERCHGEVVSLMTVGDRNCWSCHRRVSHTYPEISRLDGTERRKE